MAACCCWLIGVGPYPACALGTVLEVPGCTTIGWVAADSEYEGGGCDGGGEGWVGTWGLVMEGSMIIAIGLAEVGGGPW